MIEAPGRREDAERVEKAVPAVFKSKYPVYLIVLKYYTSRTKIAALVRELRKVAPWQDEHEARKERAWCEKIFEAKVS